MEHYRHQIKIKSTNWLWHGIRMKPNCQLDENAQCLWTPAIYESSVYLARNFKKHIFPEPGRNVALSWVILWWNHHFRANYLASFFISWSSAMSKSYSCLPSAIICSTVSEKGTPDKQKFVKSYLPETAECNFRSFRIKQKP